MRFPTLGYVVVAAAAVFPTAPGAAAGVDSELRGLPDLFVELLELRPAELLAGQPATVRVAVGNGGEAPADDVVLLVAIEREPPHWHRIDRLMRDEVREIATSLTPREPGRRELLVEVDPEAAVVELDEGNNLIRVRVDVHGDARPDEAQPDLVVTELDVGPEPAEADRAFEVRALVQNVGAGRAENVPVTLWVDGQPRGRGLVELLAPGGAEEVTLRSPPVNAGDHWLSVVVDEICWVPENNEANNRLARAVPFQRPRLPALAIESVVVSPTAPTPGERVAVSITVFNRGEAEARQVGVALFLTTIGPEGDKWVIASHAERLERIDAGQRHVVGFEWEAVPGSHTLHAEVDALDIIREREERQQVVRRPLVVGAER